MRPATKTPLLLIILLTAFPQLSETIYAPALTNIASAYQVTAAQAQLTMSVYFIAFAAGIVCWGRLADSWGRRPALIAALACYGTGAGLAIASAFVFSSFALLIMARLILAFGASAGSVVIQTMLRDSYHGAELPVVFATVGAVLSFSPAIGPPLGAALASQFGHVGVFTALCILAAVLLLSMPFVIETRPENYSRPASFKQVAIQMLQDHHIRATIYSVAGFNVILFGYYTLAPFTLQQLGMPDWLFGLSGFLIAAGGVAGAMLNRRLLARFGGNRLIKFAIVLSIAASVVQLTGFWQLAHYPKIVVGILFASQALLSVAYGCATPNLLSAALQNYRQVQGTAGALLGLTYYLLIAIGLGLISFAYQPVLEYQPLAMLLISLSLLPASKKLIQKLLK